MNQFLEGLLLIKKLPKHIVIFQLQIKKTDMLAKSAIAFPIKRNTEVFALKTIIEGLKLLIIIIKK